MRSRVLTLFLISATLLAALPLGRSQASAPARLRIGTYDSRAVAVAYAASPHNPVDAKLREHAAAKAAGDRRKVAELEAWGEARQRALHRQGFARVPVDDLLEPVRARLPEAARAAGVDALVFGCTWSAEGVEVVDATDEVVALFEPSQKTLRTIAELRSKQPLDLDELRADR